MWIILNPPAQNEPTALKNIILDSAKNSEVSEIYLVTHNLEIFDWWKAKIAHLTINAEVKGNYPDIVSLLETYNETSVVEK